MCDCPMSIQDRVALFGEGEHSLICSSRRSCGAGKVTDCPRHLGLRMRTIAVQGDACGSCNLIRRGESR